MLAGYDLSTDRLYGHVKTRKGRVEFPAFVRCLRSLHPPQVRIWVVLDNFGPHLSTTTDPGRRVGRGEQRRAGSCAAAWTVCWWCRTVPAGRSWTGCGGRRRERRVRGWCGRWTGLRAHIHTRRPPRRASPTLIRNTGKPGIPVCWRMWLSGRSSIPRNVIETGISPGSRYVLASPLVHPDPHRAR